MILRSVYYFQIKLLTTRIKRVDTCKNIPKYRKYMFLKKRSPLAAPINEIYTDKSLVSVRQNLLTVL